MPCQGLMGIRGLAGGADFWFLSFFRLQELLDDHVGIPASDFVVLLLPNQPKLCAESSHGGSLEERNLMKDTGLIGDICFEFLSIFFLMEVGWLLVFMTFFLQVLRPLIREVSEEEEGVGFSAKSVKSLNFD